MAIFNFNISVDTDNRKVIITDTETNTSKSVSFPLKSDKNDGVVEETTEPTLTLNAQKYTLNKAALELMRAKQGDRLIVAYGSNGKPVIGLQESFGVGGGNKLSSTNSVVCKGKDRELLSQFGDKFQLEPKENGIFWLINENTESKEELVLDENLQIPAENGMSNVPEVNIDDLLKDIELQDESNYTMSGLDFSF